MRPTLPVTVQLDVFYLRIVTVESLPVEAIRRREEPLIGY